MLIFTTKNIILGHNIQNKHFNLTDWLRDKHTKAKTFQNCDIKTIFKIRNFQFLFSLMLYCQQMYFRKDSIQIEWHWWYYNSKQVSNSNEVSLHSVITNFNHFSSFSYILYYASIHNIRFIEKQPLKTLKSDTLIVAVALFHFKKHLICEAHQINIFEAFFFVFVEIA